MLRLDESYVRAVGLECDRCGHIDLAESMFNPRVSLIGDGWAEVIAADRPQWERHYCPQCWPAAREALQA
jgi:hypothetical protein